MKTQILQGLDPETFEPGKTVTRYIPENAEDLETLRKMAESGQLETAGGPQDAHEDSDSEEDAQP